MRDLLWVLAIIGLSACQTVSVEQPESTVPVSVRVDDVADWIVDWHRVITLPEDQLVLVLNAWQLDFERTANPETRLRLALLLAEGPQPVRDQARALELLEGLDAEQASDSSKALAALLTQVIEEHRWSINRINAINRELKESRMHVEALERQLQELTTIEKNIQDRE